MFLRSDTSVPLTELNASLGRSILTTLQTHYSHVAPGWDVSINEGGVVTIRNTLLAGRMGVCIRTVNIDPEMKAIVRTGGQLLERYRIARDRALSVQATLEEIADQPCNNRGDLIAET